MIISSTPETPPTLREDSAAHLAGADSVDGPLFGWPLFTLDDDGVNHNVATMASACEQFGVIHAPHVKTAMSRELFNRQHDAGAWGPSVANPEQLRTVYGWGVDAAFLANELLDPREAAWLRDALTARPTFEVVVYVDSLAGVRLLARAFDRAEDCVTSRLGVVIEVGISGGRTGVRHLSQTMELGAAVRGAGLRLAGIAGYEGPAARDYSAQSLATVAAFCAELRAHASALIEADLISDADVIVSAGGSGYLDVVFDHLPGDLSGTYAGDGSAWTRSVRAIVRAGAYITHDHGLLERSDPWARMDPPRALRAAAIVWAQVLSAPEDGLALAGAGRRDVPYDIDLPVPLWVRRAEPDGSPGPIRELTGVAVTKVDDQHMYLRPGSERDVLDLAPGDVVGLGISHPCTLFDKWRTAVMLDSGGAPVEVIHTQF